MRRVRLLPVVLSALVLCGAALPAAAQPPDDAVEVARTSPLPPACAQGSPQAEDEPWTATAGDRAAAVWVQGRGAGLVAASSEDGGRSWSAPQTVPGWTTCTQGPGDFVVNPRLSLAADGTRWLVATAMGAGAQVRVARSAAGAAGWSAAVTVATGVLDFPALAAVDSRRAVVSWTDRVGDRVVVRATEDAGATWSEPQVVQLTTPGSAAFPYLAALPQGPLALVVHEPPLVPGTTPAQATVHRSDDGRSWERVGSRPALDVSLAAGQDGTLALVLTTDRTRLLSSTDARRWRTVADLPPAHPGTAPAVAVDRRGRTVLASQLVDADGRSATCVTSLSEEGRLTAQRRLAPATAAGHPGGNPFYVRPHAAGLRDGGLVLDLRGTGSDPRTTDLVATRLRADQPGPAC